MNTGRIHTFFNFTCLLISFARYPLCFNQLLALFSFFKGVLAELKIGFLKSEKIIIGSLESEKIGSLESEKSGRYRSTPGA